MKPINVLVVDDSSLVRQLLTEILSNDPDIGKVYVAQDPYQAKDIINKHNPDVISLDVEMPKMDGITFLQKLMNMRPMPVVMLSSLTEKGCDTTLKALELGAIDFITKPKLGIEEGLASLEHEVLTKIKTAARANVSKAVRKIANETATPTKVAVSEALINSTHKLIAIGTSTGGTNALTDLLAKMPPDGPGILAVIHMPDKFTGSFAERLNRSCALHVKEAEHGDRILPGHVLLAPGNKHMEVYRSGAIYSVRLVDTPPVNRFKPSVDVLFFSMSRYVGKNAIGAILTGMGNDGAKGLFAMKENGASTIAQDEHSSVVFGMPKEAIECGAVDQVLPLGQIAGRLAELGVSHTMAET